MDIKDFENKIINADCLDILKHLPDKCIDLVLTDPPYGIGFGTFNRTNKLKNGQRVKADKYKNSDWDSEIPHEEIFKEIFRVSKNQIIWGGGTISPNYGNMAEGDSYFGRKTTLAQILVQASLRGLHLI